jgi:hypothetical protein
MPRDVVFVFPAMHMKINSLETIIPREKAENFVTRGL